MSYLQQLTMCYLTDGAIDSIVVACAGRNAALRSERQRLRKHLLALKKSSDTWSTRQPKMHAVKELEEQAMHNIWEATTPQSMASSRKDSDHDINFHGGLPILECQPESQMPGIARRNGMSGTPELFEIRNCRWRDPNDLGQASPDSTPNSFTVPPAWSWDHQTSFPQVALPTSPPTSLESKFKTLTNSNISQASLPHAWPQDARHVQPKEQKLTQNEAGTQQRTPAHGISKYPLELGTDVFFHPGVAWMSSAAKLSSTPGQGEEPPVLGPFYPPLHDHIVSLKILAHRDWKFRPADFLMPIPPPQDLHVQNQYQPPGWSQVKQEIPRNLVPRGGRKVRFADTAEREPSQDEGDIGGDWEETSLYGERLKVLGVRLRPGQTRPREISQRVKGSGRMNGNIGARVVDVQAPTGNCFTDSMRSAALLDAVMAARKKTGRTDENVVHDRVKGTVTPHCLGHSSDGIAAQNAAYFFAMTNESEEWDPDLNIKPEEPEEKGKGRVENQDAAFVLPVDNESEEWDPCCFVESEEKQKGKARQ